MSDENTLSFHREELLRHILPREVLEYCQERYAGAIQLHLVRRNRAIVTIWGEEVRFSLPRDESIPCQLQAWALRKTGGLETDQPALWGLAKHIAAEAMLALRNGHKEYVRVKKRKKPASVPKAGVH